MGKKLVTPHDLVGKTVFFPQIFIISFVKTSFEKYYAKLFNKVLFLIIQLF